MPEKKVRFGVVGTGHGANIHVPAYTVSAHTEVTAVCSGRQSRAEEVARFFDIPHATDDYRKTDQRFQCSIASLPDCEREPR